jgi:hypothetical protein
MAEALAIVAMGATRAMACRTARAPPKHGQKELVANRKSATEKTKSQKTCFTEGVLYGYGTLYRLHFPIANQWYDTCSGPEAFLLREFSKQRQKVECR